ncbi:MAG: hypothetical protein LBF55_03795 [Prevotellaceae bacterium]|nr:hypothetical protein [Prevotellaceae bacterium]
MTSFLHTILAACGALSRRMYAALSLLWTHSIALAVYACAQSSRKARISLHAAQLFSPIEVKIPPSIWRLGKNNFYRLGACCRFLTQQAPEPPKSLRGSTK